MSKWNDSPLKITTTETGAGGDCLFHALAKAIEQWSGARITYRHIREELSNCIDQENAAAFAHQVREDHNAYLPVGALDFNKVRFSENPEHAANKLRTIIRRPGWHFPGTDICVAMLTRESVYFLKEGGVGVIMFNSHGPGFTRIEPDPNISLRGTYLCVYAIGNMHWQLARAEWDHGTACFVSGRQLMDYLHLL
jgi:hypothetical protein